MDEAFLIPDAAPMQRLRLGPLTALGRHPDNTVELTDRSVSKFHARIQRRDDGFVLEDLGSRNGTFVAGQRIQRHALTDGDQITFGTVVYRFHFRKTTAGQPIITGVQLSTGNRTMLGPAVGSGSLGRVALTDGPVPAESSSFRVQSERFLPVDQITDVEVLRTDYEKLRVAHELAASLRLDLPPLEMLRQLARRVFDLIPADRCAILLMSEDQSSLEPVVAMERDGGEPSDTIRVSQTVLGEVMLNKKAVVSSDAATDGRFNAAASIVALSIRSAMSVPMLVDDELLGVLHVDTLRQRGAFAPKDVEVFTSIASRAAAAVKNARLILEVQREVETRARLGRLLSPNLVEEVVAGKLDLAPGGQKRAVAVVFTDVRGFTTMTERMDAQDVTSLLNECLEVQVDVLFQHGGTLDKYLGDGMMALFGVPRPTPNAALSAVRCAVSVQHEIANLNRTRNARGEPPLPIGIGITFGEVVWGPLGSQTTMDYTAVGDVVNTASRLCGLAPGGEILVSQAVRDALMGVFVLEELPATSIKGKADPVRIFRVLREVGG